MKITKKVYSEYFKMIAAGEKTFELRLADWQCSKGDDLELIEIDDKSRKPTGRSMIRQVGQVVKTKDIDFWPTNEISEHGYQVISLLNTGKSYTFSPIQDKNQLEAAIRFVHFECHRLCQQSLGVTLPIAGNVGIFCHYNDEYRIMTELREELTEPSEDTDQKYFKLHNPITIPATSTIPETTYTHLYIRKPDPYRHHIGDIDFCMPEQDYAELKSSLMNGTDIEGVRVFPRNDLDMIELFKPDIDALAYISTNRMTEKVRKKISEETKL